VALELLTSKALLSESAACDRQPLSAVDLALRCVDRAIRGMGYPGFETQMLVWLAGRVDLARLRHGMLRLSMRHPVLTAKLVERGPDSRSCYWAFQPGAQIALHEAHLTSDDSSEVFAYAGRLQSTSHDPTASAPLRFYLLHRPGGRDVLMMQYNHVLMDNGVAGLLLRELARLSGSEDHSLDAPRFESRRLLNDYLRRFPHAIRRAAARSAIELQAYSLRGRAAILGTGEEDKPRQVNLKVAARSLPADATRAIHERTIASCGFPNLSMAILASTFRAIHQLADDRNAERSYMAGIGLDLNLRRGSEPLIQNLLSIVPIVARRDDLADNDGLMRMLSRQMRDRLAAKIDLGALRLIVNFQRRPRHIRWVVEHLLRWGYSLWYAYFGSLDSIGRRLWDVEVERICCVGPTWSPMGISLLVNQFRGQLLFQATHDPELVSEQLASAFLDNVLSDLRTASGS
jgi:hypothetical protein